MQLEPYYYLAVTSGLSCSHIRVGEFAPYMFYHVRAYKRYIRDNEDSFIHRLIPGMTEKEVLWLLQELDK
ncbi:MAG: hypothetical protein PHH43_04140 [Candidatus Cloacimonetes bacterium]|nr:hypothetical protein [Candidatus Cloacimonadota bacterium]MDD3235496.1 hypothetical protein [Candidatus Cloacimonadota bacterium]